MSSPLRILVGLFVGLLAGLVLARQDATSLPALLAAITPVGKLWLAALQMTVVPLVLSLLVTGVAAVSDAASSGRIARRAVLVFLAFLAASAAFGTLGAWLLYQLVPADAALSSSMRAAAGLAGDIPQLPSMSQWLQGIVPSNVLAAASQNAVLPLVVFALCFAFALTRIASQRRVLVVEFFQAIADAMIVIVRWVLWLAPLGVAALIFPVAAGTGLDVVRALAVHIALLTSLCALLTLAMYPVAVLAGKQRLATFVRAIWPAQAVALSTQSSLASLPATVACATQGLQMPARSTAIVLPLAVSLMRLTSPAKNVAAVMFISWSLAIELGPLQLLAGGLVALVVSIGAVGLPGQVSFMGQCVPIAQAMGLPVAPLGMLLAVDVIPDMIGTVGNVTANVTATTVVNRLESAET